MDVQRVAGGALTSLGEPRRALELMTGAAARARPNDPVRAAEILAEATGPAIMQGEMHLVRELAEQVECIWEHSPEAAAAATPTALAMVAGAFSISGDIDRADRLPAPRRRIPTVVQQDGGTARRGVPRPKSRLGRAVLRGPLTS